MSEFERLKQLLLVEEREALAQLHARADANDRAHAKVDADDAARDAQITAANEAMARLPDELPRILDQSYRGDSSERLADAFSGPVADALAGAVEKKRQVVVDALFPVILPAIRRAVAEMLREFSDSINRVSESFFTARGVKWRLESIRSGVPYAQVALKHTLKYRIDHLFLIQRDSGLILHHEAFDKTGEMDSDAVAGMLSAIQDFVRDSVGKGEGGGLRSASVGEHVLWVAEGPHANLAAMILGVPPPNLTLVLQEKLEALHGVHASALQKNPETAAREAPLADELELKPLNALQDNAEGSDAQAGSMNSLMLGVGALLAVLLGLWALNAWWNRRIEATESKLQAVAGFVPLKIEHEWNWPGFKHLSWRPSAYREATIHGLRDPLVDMPQALARKQLGLAQIKFETRPYVSADDAILAARARQWLQAPDSVQFTAAQGVLRVHGAAQGDWINRLKNAKLQIPGVENWNWAELNNLDEDRLRVIDAELARVVVPLQRATDVTDETAARLSQVIALLQEAQRLMQRSGQTATATVIGLNDETGSEAANNRVRMKRAEWLVAQLQAQEQLKPSDMTLVAAAEAGSPIAARGAIVRLYPSTQSNQ